MSLVVGVCFTCQNYKLYSGIFWFIIKKTYVIGYYIFFKGFGNIGTTLREIPYWDKVSKFDDLSSIYRKKFVLKPLGEILMEKLKIYLCALVIFFEKQKIQVFTLLGVDPGSLELIFDSIQWIQSFLYPD